MAGQVDESVDGVEVERLLGVEDDVDGGTSCVAGLLSCFAKLFSCCDDELVGDGAGGAKRKRSNEEADEDEDDEGSGDSASLDPVAESTETAVSVEVSDSDEPAIAQAHAWLAEKRVQPAGEAAAADHVSAWLAHQVLARKGRAGGGRRVREQRVAVVGN